MVLDLPFELIKQPAEKEDTTNECYSMSSGNGFRIITNYRNYSGPANPENLVQDKINEIQKLDGIRDIQWNRSDTLIGNRNGTIVSIRYNLAEYRMKRNAIIVCDKNNVWEVITQYSEDDSTSRQLSARILASIEIK